LDIISLSPDLKIGITVAIFQDDESDSLWQAYVHGLNLVSLYGVQKIKMQHFVDEIMAFLQHRKLDVLLCKRW